MKRRYLVCRVNVCLVRCKLYYSETATTAEKKYNLNTKRFLLILLQCCDSLSASAAVFVTELYRVYMTVLAVADTDQVDSASEDTSDRTKITTTKTVSKHATLQYSARAET